MVAISGQSATTSMHKESHQVLDLLNLFHPISKFCAQIIEPRTVPEVVRKAFKQAQSGRFSVSYIDFPENVAQMEVADAPAPLTVQPPVPPVPAASQIRRAADLISQAKYPIILAGNGVIRAGAAADFMRFVEKLNIPVATTFMAKGLVPFSHRLSLGVVGLKARDLVMCGFDRADLVITVGYDIVEYNAQPWNPEKRHKIVHIGPVPAEVDEYYSLAVEVQGHVGAALEGDRRIGETPGRLSLGRAADGASSTSWPNRRKIPVYR